MHRLGEDIFQDRTDVTIRLVFHAAVGATLNEKKGVYYGKRPFIREIVSSVVP